VVGVFNQGLALYGLGRTEEARRRFLDALDVGLRFAWPEGIVYAVEALAITFVASGDHDLGVRAAASAARARELHVLRPEEPQATFLRDALTSGEAALGPERFAAALVAGRELSLDDAARELVAAGSARSG
jgi:hypothetical protein